MSKLDIAGTDSAAMIASEQAAQDWVGRSQTRQGRLAPEVAEMLMGALSHPAAPGVPTHPGAPVPPLWHWAAFPDFVPIEGIGADGHPKLGGFLPPLPFNRRMWAGGRLSFSGQLGIGEAITRRSEILSINFKSGSTGNMALVRVCHDLRGERGAQIREEQDLVYSPIPDRFRPPRRIPAPATPLFREVVEIGPVRLFRYSAATYNAHRIHYDRAYAVDTEKYPGLVVHGPMQATLLIEAAMRFTGRAPTRFSYRGVHPIFDGALTLQAEHDGAGSLKLCTVAPEGHQGMQARFEWEG